MILPPTSLLPSQPPLAGSLRFLQDGGMSGAAEHLASLPLHTEETIPQPGFSTQCISTFLFI